MNKQPLAFIKRNFTIIEKDFNHSKLYQSKDLISNMRQHIFLIKIQLSLKSLIPWQIGANVQFSTGYEIERNLYA